MKKSPREQLRLRMKFLAMLLQMKDVTEQRMLEKRSADLHPNDAASVVIGGEFKLSPHTVSVLKGMELMKQQIAAAIRSE